MSTRDPDAEGPAHRSGRRDAGCDVRARGDERGSRRPGPPEMSPNAEPPVGKILDFGKFKYEQQKKGTKPRRNKKSLRSKR